MRISNHKIVTVSYELYENDAEGDLMERMDSCYPFVFLFGSNKLLPRFQQHLEGLNTGESFDFTLTPEDAYGKYDPKQVVDVPMDSFKIKGVLQEDLLVEGQNINLKSRDGADHVGTVLWVHDKSVTVDFNHAMADKTLFFTGIVLDVREATIDEIIQQTVLNS